MIDVTKLKEPVSAEAPCGEDLEYDDAFLELQLISQHKPEQRMGDSVIPSQEPVWRDVEAKCVELFERTKDLRVAVQLIKALMHTGGYPGASQGLELLRSMIEEQWSGLHPQMDPDDGNDPMMRFNILSDLADSSMLMWVRKLPLVSVRGVGNFGLRALELASGDVAPVAGETVPSQALIDGAFGEGALEDMAPVAAATRACASDLADIEGLLFGHADGAHTPNLTPLRKLFEEAASTMKEKLADRGVVAGAMVVGDALEQGVADGGGGAVAAAPVTEEATGEISSRKHVIKALDKILNYYASNEPSSPLPLLLARCKKLVNMTFMDIIRDMAPDGVSQIETLRGPSEDEEEEEDSY